MMTINEKKEVVYKMIEHSIKSNPSVFKSGMKTLESFSYSEVFSSPQYAIFSIIDYFLAEKKKGKTEKEIVESLKEKKKISSPESCTSLTAYIQQRIEQEYSNKVCSALLPLTDDFFDIIEGKEPKHTETAIPFYSY